jgi:hypothetical protein
MAYLLSIEWQYNGKVMDYTYLVGGSGHFLYFHILGIIIPTDFHIFQRGRSTTNQIYYNGNIWQIPIKLSFEIHHLGKYMWEIHHLLGLQANPREENTSSQAKIPLTHGLRWFLASDLVDSNMVKKTEPRW